MAWAVGTTARRSRTATKRDCARYEITAEVEGLEAPEDEPITRLRTTITNQDGVVVLDRTALVWTEPL
jgi:hypothetical protein